MLHSHQCFTTMSSLTHSLWRCQRDKLLRKKGMQMHRDASAHFDMHRSWSRSSVDLSTKKYHTVKREYWILFVELIPVDFVVVVVDLHVWKVCKLEGLNSCNEIKQTHKNLLPHVLLYLVYKVLGVDFSGIKSVHRSQRVVQGQVCMVWRVWARATSISSSI